jgi:membrane-associated phospholipid phosphatase
MPQSQPVDPSGRRSFLTQATATTVAALTVRGEASAQTLAEPSGDASTLGDQARRLASAVVRHQAETANFLIPVPAHPTNGDETRYPDFIGSYSKGLPHNARGEVNPAAFNRLRNVMASGRPADFETLILGCPDPSTQVRLTNPQAGLAFDLEGTDSHQLAQRPAPAFASAEEAGEMAEMYWMALLRDVPFLDYDTSPAAHQAAQGLSALSDFRGPKVGGQVTTGTLFRDNLPGVQVGPYISQFLWMNTPFGAELVNRLMRTLQPGIDHLTSFADWLAVQNGCPAPGQAQFDAVRSYIRNGRDLSQWVHIDVLFQAYFNAMLVLLSPLDLIDTGSSGLGAPFNPGNPYRNSRTQAGFGTFGPPHIAALMCEVATRALKAVWYQKWFVHRRLRPEAFGGRIHVHRTGLRSYPIHGDILNSPVLSQVFSAHGSYLLPMAFPEGSPTHPSYGAGHATVAGACVTILKAFFDGSFVVPDPVVPTPDGQALVPFGGPDLTVTGELNKLASNVATGRNIAGVHWRSDAVESLKLGEAVALSVLRDQRRTYNEAFGGFTFQKFDGTTVTV